MSAGNPWQDLSNWALTRGTTQEKRFALRAVEPAKAIAQASYLYGPWMLLALSKQMIEALHESLPR